MLARCDWDALRRVREALPAHIPFIANGDIAIPSDFDAIMQATGAQAGMCGYGALLNPGVFNTQGPPPTLAQMLQDYLSIARVHRNQLVDLQRHVAWLVKSHTEKSVKGLRRAPSMLAVHWLTTSSATAELFETRSVSAIVALLNARIAGLNLALEDGVVEVVEARGSVADISDPKKRARAEKRERRVQRKLEDRKRAREEKAAALRSSQQPEGAAVDDAVREKVARTDEENGP